MKNVIAFSGLMFLASWFTLGAGLIGSIVRDNPNMSDRMLIGGFVGCLYVALTAAILIGIHDIYKGWKDNNR